MADDVAVDSPLTPAERLRFRAENAHRLPTTQAGWYLYHKSKNYVSLLGGLKEGFRMGGRLALWTGLFAGMEQGIDRFRSVAYRTFLAQPSVEPLPPRGSPAREIERRRRITERREREAERERSNDFLSTTFAGLGTAGVFSLVNGFPLPTFRRIAMMGVKAGFAFGLLQDAVSMARGRRLGYVEWIRSQLGRETTEDSVAVESNAG
ncbi:hypothetical protein B0A48_00368 [Cryoendolithus antarcticus]|uniref:Uncharacterized protein n=1 Tax=Cryoendolithus antarcticus TaxID=1507870 RepID=A0A1V8TUH8_9PEZI|nr:hypothetical protein B0A48_00368 [Cryoendolithus antarcticus]